MVSGQSVFSACDIFGDRASSRRAYSLYMGIKHRELLDEDADVVADNGILMERGWGHGDKEFRKSVLEDLRKRRIDISSLLDKSQKAYMAKIAVEAVMLKCLKYLGIKKDELPELPKSDERKQLTAGTLRYHYPVKIEWVSKKLCVGHFTTVSRAMRFYDKAEGESLVQKKRIIKFIAPLPRSGRVWYREC